MELVQTTASSPALSSAETTDNVTCLVCAGTFKAIEDFKEHSIKEHDILIDKQVLENSAEDDDFTKMLKSMVVANQYLQDRVKYYPEHWDHIDLRIKIRMIAKMKYEGISRQIDRSMVNISSLKTSQGVLSNEI